MLSSLISPYSELILKAGCLGDREMVAVKFKLSFGNWARRRRTSCTSLTWAPYVHAASRFIK